MNVSAIQEASRRIRDFENEVLEGQGSHAWDLYDTLVRLRSESLELFSAMAAVMFDEEIGKKAREIVERTRTGKVTPVTSSFVKEQTEDPRITEGNLVHAQAAAWNAADLIALASDPGPGPSYTGQPDDWEDPDAALIAELDKEYGVDAE